jgi:hypothetical protein
LLADKTAEPTGKSTPGFIQLSEAVNGLASESRNWIGFQSTPRVRVGISFGVGSYGIISADARLTALDVGRPVDIRLHGGFREVRLAEQDFEIEIGFVLSSGESQLENPREVDVASAIVLHVITHMNTGQSGQEGCRAY